MPKKQVKKTGKAIQTEILDYIRHECGGFVVAYKVVIGNEKGIPDILCCINGEFVAMEVKGAGDVLSAIQAAQMVRIHTAGGKSYVVMSLQEAKDIIKGILNG